MSIEKVISVILAAGLSTRMGEDKALIKIHGKPTILSIINKLEFFTEKFVIIVSNNEEQISSLIENHLQNISYQILKNNHPGKGMFSSIQIATRSIKENNLKVLIHPIDVPVIRAETYQQLFNSTQKKYKVWKPSIYISGKKKSGHPIIVAPEIMEKIYTEPEDSNLKLILQRYYDQTQYILVNDPGILHNINTKQELHKILEKKNGNISS